MTEGYDPQQEGPTASDRPPPRLEHRPYLSLARVSDPRSGYAYIPRREELEAV
jgi:hypothetical protein